MYSFGISNHSPDQALEFLLRRKIISDLSEIAVVPSGTVLSSEKKPSRNILFIISVSDFYRNMKVLNSAAYREVRVFMFASALRVAEMENMTPLDFTPSPANKGVAFNLEQEISLTAYKAALKNPSLDKGAAQVRRLDTQYLTLLTDNVKTGSLLNPLMSFLYTLPQSTHQTPVKEAVAVYLYKGTSFKKLQSLLDDIKGVIVSKRVRDTLKTILKSPEGENIRQAFAAYRASKENEKATALAVLAKRHQVSVYELKYIKSVYDARMDNKSHRGTKIGAALKKKAA